MSHPIVLVILPIAAAVIYAHRKYVESVVAKEVAVVKADHAATISSAKDYIAKVITFAKAEAAKTETTATSLVAKVEIYLKKVL